MLGDRKKPIARSTKPLPRRSRSPQRAAYREVDEASGGYCLACGTSYGLEHSHILTQGRYQLHKANPLNIVMLCGRVCHPLWEHNKSGFAHRFPEAFAEKLRRMQLIDRQAYAFFMMKNPTLF